MQENVQKQRKYIFSSSTLLSDKKNYLINMAHIALAVR